MTTAPAAITTWTIPAIIARAASEFGGAEAVVDGDVRLTFAELAAHVDEASRALIASGVRKGDRVAVWAPNGHRWIIAALGAVSVGAILVPINTRYKADEAEWILTRSGARIVFVHNGFLGVDYSAMLASISDDPGRIEIVDFATHWDSFLRRAGSSPVHSTTHVAPDDIADMFFTSGTTGKPKGALLTHEQDLRVFHTWATTVGLRQGDRYLVVNPMFHSFGYKAGVLACLIAGATLVSQATFDVPESMRLIETERITVFPGPPTIYASILDHPSRADHDLSSLRLAVTGAASVPVALIERVRNELFETTVIAYGMTETCGTITINSPDADSETMATTVGRAIAGTEVRVVGPDGIEMPSGQPGEVVVRGYNVMKGYFEDPAATIETIDPDGWLHTGDIGVMDESGLLKITDRLKDMFLVGGFNTYPAEIEQTIMRHPDVSEVAVIGVPDERLGEVGHAFVLARPGHEVDEASVLEFCREHLANFKVPRGITVVDALPRNAGGKVTKFVLREQYEKQHEKRN